MGKTKELESNFFRENLIRLRNERGWSQSVLASKIVEADLLPKLSEGAVKMWESGARSPGPKSRKAVAKLFGVTESYLLDDHTSQPEAPPLADNPSRPEAIGRLNVAISMLSDDEVKSLMRYAEAWVKDKAKLKV